MKGEWRHRIFLESCWIEEGCLSLRRFSSCHGRITYRHQRRWLKIWDAWSRRRKEKTRRRRGNNEACFRITREPWSGEEVWGGSLPCWPSSSYRNRKVGTRRRKQKNTTKRNKEWRTHVPGSWETKMLERELHVWRLCCASASGGFFMSILSSRVEPRFSTPIQNKTG